MEFTITGVYLPDTGILIQANDSIKAMTTGTATEQKATLTFPANDTENDQPYTVTNSLDSRTAAVTVAKKYSGGSSGGGGGGGHRPKPKPTVEIPDDDALGLNNTDHFAYVVGYENGEVQPQNSITRAEVAAIFFRLLENGIRSENFTHQNDFSDVAADAWYCSSVSTLSRMDIIAGIPMGHSARTHPSRVRNLRQSQHALTTTATKRP